MSFWKNDIGKQLEIMNDYLKQIDWAVQFIPPIAEKIGVNLDYQRPEPPLTQYYGSDNAKILNELEKINIYLDKITHNLDYLQVIAMDLHKESKPKTGWNSKPQTDKRR